MRHAARVADGVARFEPVVLVADPQLQAAFEDDQALLVRLVRVGIGTGAATGLDGMPLERDRVLVGAVGVSGGSAEEDQRAVDAAVRAFESG
jgi:uncharacterized protein GlcG (DUF336 family)